MDDILYDVGGVRRADIRLKTIYYGIKTKIFLIEPSHYAIQILSYIELFDVIKKEFDYKIKMVADWIDLVLDKPNEFIKEIEPFDNIAESQEGIFLTMSMLKSLLISKFNKVEFYKIEEIFNNGFILNINVGKDTDDDIVKDIENFILDLKIRCKKVIISKEKSGDSIMVSEVLLACTDKNFKFSREDTDFWFDNVDRIYSGELKKDELKFFDNDSTKCYMDFSIFNNENINIRSNVLLYDKVYISLPLEDNLQSFLKQQNLDINDLEELIENNKLIIFLPNSENRYDRNLINHLYSLNKNCIVSKRGINTLMAIFFNELEREYMAFWDEGIFKEIIEILIKNSDPKLKKIYDYLIWPYKARRDSYELFNSSGPLRIPSIGINNLLSSSIDEIDKNSNKLSFEFLSNATSIHIATALQSTYFPFWVSSKEGKYSDSLVSSILSNMLTMYLYPSGIQQDEILNFEENLKFNEEGIHLLRTQNDVSLKHIIDYANKYNTPETLKTILKNVGKLNIEQQEKTIKEYNNLIAEIGKENFNSKSALSLLLSGLGLYPNIGELASIIGIIKEVLERFGLKDYFVKSRFKNNTQNKNDEVYILDKLNRVAHIEFNQNKIL